MAAWCVTVWRVGLAALLLVIAGTARAKARRFTWDAQHVMVVHDAAARGPAFEGQEQVRNCKALQDNFATGANAWSRYEPSLSRPLVQMPAQGATVGTAAPSRERAA